MDELITNMNKLSVIGWAGGIVVLSPPPPPENLEKNECKMVQIKDIWKISLIRLV